LLLQFLKFLQFGSLKRFTHRFVNMRAEQSVHSGDHVHVGTHQNTYAEQNINSLAHERLPAWPPAEHPSADGKRQRNKAAGSIATELIQTLHGDFDRFITAQLNTLLAEHTGYGLGRLGFKSVTCAPLMTAAQDTMRELQKLDQSMHKGTAPNIIVRDFILETQTLLRTFLLDFSEMAPQGELNRGALSAAVGYCIDVAKALGKLVLGLEQVKLQMRAATSAA
jgi:hypothetical protein